MDPWSVDVQQRCGIVALIDVWPDCLPAGYVLRVGDPRFMMINKNKK
jgi:hypothetical protein